MPFNLNKFLANGLVWGGARPSKFDVQLTLPPELSGIDTNFAGTNTSKFTFSCKAASIPSFQVGVVPIPYFGRKIKSAGDRTWDDWRITVMLDEDYVTRAAFEAWNNGINNIESNVMTTSLDGEAYKADWTVTHYSKDGNPIAVYTVHNGWPRALGPITLDWDGTDRISQFEVDVAFDNFYPTGSGVTFAGTTSTDYTPDL